MASPLHQNRHLIRAHFAKLVAGDAVQFRNQFPEFDLDPSGQMRQVLKALNDEAQGFKRDDLQFVDELVFGPVVPFEQARALFVALADQLLSDDLGTAAASAGAGAHISAS